MRVVADFDRCIASGGCVVACPEVFAQDDDGIVVLLQENPPQELNEKVEEAFAICPAACLWSE